MSGLVPRIAVVNGRCFAGNAVIAACADLTSATENASIGWAACDDRGAAGGRACTDEVGPISVQAPTGWSTSWSPTRHRPSP